MIMEKAQGKALDDIWYTMSPAERENLMEKVAQIEGLLFNLKLPASGSIYFTNSLPDGTKTVLLPDNKAFCIGPSTEYLWWHLGRDRLEADRGPWKSSVDLLNAVGYRELEWLHRYGKPRYPREPLYRAFYENKRVDPDIQMSNLENYLLLAPPVAPDNVEMNNPTIRHPDLSPSNIFVTETGDISCIIDWERTSVLPLFLQAKVPQHFQNWGDEVSENFAEPALPPNMGSLDEEEKEVELELYRRRQIHYYYLGFTSRHNASHFGAMASHSGTARSRLYDVAGRPWEGDNTTLKATLIEMSSYWPEMASAGAEEMPYPIAYSEEEARQCLEIDAKQKKANTLQNLRDGFGINIDGWTTNNAFVEAMQKMKDMKRLMLGLAETEEEREDLLVKWPFQDHEEID